MAVASDLTLSSTPDLRSATRMTPSSERAGEASRKDTTSFAELYAQEQQPARKEPTQSARVERREMSEKPERASKSTQERDTEVPTRTNAAPAEKKTASADSGKSLPVGEEEEPVPEAQLDPLLLLGMTGQLPEEPAIPPSLSGNSLTSALEMVEEGADNPAVALLPTDTLILEGTSSLQEVSRLSGSVAPNADTKANALTQQVNTDVSKQPIMMATVLSEQVATEGDLAGDALQLLSEADDGKGTSAAKAESFTDRLGALTQAMSASAQTTRPVMPTVPGQPVPMNQPGWSEAVVDRVMWMSSQNLKSADIQMEPAGLGRLEVRIQMSPEQTQVTFASPHAAVRDALDSQSQRLRDLFVQQGMTLDVNVSDQSMHRSWQGSQGDSRPGSGRSTGLHQDEAVEQVGSMTIETPVQTTLKRDDGHVDYYA
ncbi:flagellar hook-length control protein FliK [Pseudomonas duriflava]|uniref:Flagellar hook-length control protein FliK n=1 Tax=Pseudomonas duriflava TaxID=459528 RepID=A0A562QAZ7_9PSED|nr:flagellar hook-length control protein FliK [Pseudomonas duriflava]TWI53917.1 flagellar hook-length control protein FliK [Pseudomonas duriflava]